MPSLRRNSLSTGRRGEWKKKGEEEGKRGGGRRGKEESQRHRSVGICLSSSPGIMSGI